MLEGIIIKACFNRDASEYMSMVGRLTDPDFTFLEGQVRVSRLGLAVFGKLRGALASQATTRTDTDFKLGLIRYTKRVMLLVLYNLRLISNSIDVLSPAQVASVLNWLVDAHCQFDRFVSTMTAKLNLKPIMLEYYFNRDYFVNLLDEIRNGFERIIEHDFNSVITQYLGQVASWEALDVGALDSQLFGYFKQKSGLFSRQLLAQFELTFVARLAFYLIQTMVRLHRIEDPGGSLEYDQYRPVLTKFVGLVSRQPFEKSHPKKLASKVFTSLERFFRSQAKSEIEESIHILTTIAKSQPDADLVQDLIELKHFRDERLQKQVASSFEVIVSSTLQAQNLPHKRSLYTKLNTLRAVNAFAKKLWKKALRKGLIVRSEVECPGEPGAGAETPVATRRVYRVADPSSRKLDKPQAPEVGPKELAPKKLSCRYINYKKSTFSDYNYIKAKWVRPQA